MIQTSDIISDIKQDFEGGKSLAVDWDSIIRRAVETVIENCKPETLKRVVPIYGGLIRDILVYYCPSDVLVPSMIYGNDGKVLYRYVAPKIFREQQNQDEFTIEYLNGVRFILIRHARTLSELVIDEMEAVGTKTGGTPTLNTHNFLNGAGAVEATFTDAGVEFGDDISQTDISDYYLRGVALLPSSIPTAANLVSLELRLKTTDADYYSLITTADSISSYIIDGWNQIRFDFANKTTTGTPDPENIVEWSVIGTTTSGKTMTIIFDRLTLQKTAQQYFQYISKNAYIDGTTGVYWKASLETAINDQVNIDRDVRGILHYECCLLVQQSGTFDRIDSNATRRFEGQLQRKYLNYYAEHPSDSSPISYSISPQIDLGIDDGLGQIQDQTTETTT